MDIGLQQIHAAMALKFGNEVLSKIGAFETKHGSSVLKDE